jgi:hypothetical protein
MQISVREDELRIELAIVREKNRLERLEFIRSYAAWVLRVPNCEWSSQQAELINAFMENAGNYALSREQYLRIMGMRKSVRRTPHCD